MLTLLLRLLGFLTGQHLATPSQFKELNERCRKLVATNHSLEDWVSNLQKQAQIKEHSLHEQYRRKEQVLLTSLEQLRSQLEVQKYRSSQLAMNSDLEMQKHLSENRALLAQLNWLSGTIAHDFRAPLRAIDANCFFLQDDLGDQGPPDALKTLSEIKRNGQRMGTLIDGLLDYLRVGIAPLNLHKRNLGDLLNQVIDEDFSLLQYPVAVEGHFRTGFACDSELIKRLLKELIDNAVKFSSQSERMPRVIVRGVSDYQIEIIDSGVGFKREHTDQLFQLFHRLHGNDEFPGEGIGLCVAQRIALRHNGNVTLQRIEGNTVATILFNPEPIPVENQTILESSSSRPAD